MTRSLMLFAMVLTTSSSAFAGPLSLACRDRVALNEKVLEFQAGNVVAEMENLINEQIEEDGEPQIARYANGRAARAMNVMDAVKEVRDKGLTADEESQRIAMELCNTNLDLRSYVLGN